MNYTVYKVGTHKSLLEFEMEDCSKSLIIERLKDAGLLGSMATTHSLYIDHDIHGTLYLMSYETQTTLYRIKKNT